MHFFKKKSLHLHQNKKVVGPSRKSAIFSRNKSHYIRDPSLSPSDLLLLQIQLQLFQFFPKVPLGGVNFKLQKAKG
jgi:hypothetical protein